MRDINAIMAIVWHDVLEDSLMYYTDEDITTLTREEAIQLRAVIKTNTLREQMFRFIKRKTIELTIYWALIKMQSNLIAQGKPVNFDPFVILKMIRVVTKDKDRNLLAVRLYEWLKARNAPERIIKISSTLVERAKTRNLAKRLERMVKMGPEVILMKLADRIHNMRSDRSSTNSELVQHYVLGKGPAPKNGTIYEFMEIIIPSTGKSFLDSLPDEYEDIKAIFKVEILRAILENLDRLGQVNTIAAAVQAIGRIGIVVETAGKANARQVFEQAMEEIEGSVRRSEIIMTNVNHPLFGLEIKRIANQVRAFGENEQKVKDVILRVRQAVIEGTYYLKVSDDALVNVLGVNGKPLYSLEGIDINQSLEVLGTMNVVAAKVGQYVYRAADVLVFTPDRSKVVLIIRSNAPYMEYLSAPGGMVPAGHQEDSAEIYAQAAAQKLKEEFGLDQAPNTQTLEFYQFNRRSTIGDGGQKGAVFFYTLTKDQFHELEKNKNFSDDIKLGKSKEEYIEFLRLENSMMQGSGKAMDFVTISLERFLDDQQKNGSVVVETYAGIVSQRLALYTPDLLAAWLKDEAFKRAVKQYSQQAVSNNPADEGGNTDQNRPLSSPKDEQGISRVSTMIMLTGIAGALGLLLTPKIEGALINTISVGAFASSAVVVGVLAMISGVVAYMTRENKLRVLSETKANQPRNDNVRSGILINQKEEILKLLMWWSLAEGRRLNFDYESMRENLEDNMEHGRQFIVMHSGENERSEAVLIAHQPNAQKRLLELVIVEVDEAVKKLGLGRGLVRKFIEVFGADYDVEVQLSYKGRKANGQQLWEAFFESLGFSVRHDEYKYYFRSHNVYAKDKVAKVAAAPEVAIENSGVSNLNNIYRNQGLSDIRFDIDEYQAVNNSSNTKSFESSRLKFVIKLIVPLYPLIAAAIYKKAKAAIRFVKGINKGPFVIAITAIGLGTLLSGVATEVKAATGTIMDLEPVSTVAIVFALGISVGVLLWRYREIIKSWAEWLTSRIRAPSAKPVELLEAERVDVIGPESIHTQKSLVDDVESFVVIERSEIAAYGIEEELLNQLSEQVIFVRGPPSADAAKFVKDQKTYIRISDTAVAQDVRYQINAVLNPGLSQEDVGTLTQKQIVESDNKEAVATPQAVIANVPKPQPYYTLKPYFRGRRLAERLMRGIDQVSREKIKTALLNNSHSNPFTWKFNNYGLDETDILVGQKGFRGFAVASRQIRVLGIVGEWSLAKHAWSGDFIRYLQYIFLGVEGLDKVENILIVFARHNTQSMVIDEKLKIARMLFGIVDVLYADIFGELENDVQDVLSNEKLSVRGKLLSKVQRTSGQVVGGTHQWLYKLVREINEIIQGRHWGGEIVKHNNPVHIGEKIDLKAVAFRKDPKGIRKVYLHSNMSGQWMDYPVPMTFEGSLSNNRPVYTMSVLPERNFEFTFYFVNRNGSIDWADVSRGNGKVFFVQEFNGTVAFVGSEIRGLVQKGGQGDVMYELPKALTEMGNNAPVIIPLYKNLASQTAYADAKEVEGFRAQVIFHQRKNVVITAKHLNLTGIPVYLLEADAEDLFTEPYWGPSNGRPDLEMYDSILLAYGTLKLFMHLKQPPMIFVISDHHTALMALLMRAIDPYKEFYAKTALLATFHNMGYQGKYPLSYFEELGIPDTAEMRALVTDGDEINMLGIVPQVIDQVGKKGNLINAVSKGYAEESRPMRFNDTDLLNRIGGRFVGILNGIHFMINNPATKNTFFRNYSIENGIDSVMTARAQNKRNLQQRLSEYGDLHGIPDKVIQHGSLMPNSRRMLLGGVSRLVGQKQLEIIADSIENIFEGRVAPMDFDFVLGGYGDPALERRFADLAKDPRRLKFGMSIVYLQGNVQTLGDMIYSSVDAFIVPSNFEPCGITQMLALRYGAVPIVSFTGGLADTVFESGTGQNGFTFKIWPRNEKPKNDKERLIDAQARLHNAGQLREAIERAIRVYSDHTDVWKHFIQNGMLDDNDWTRSIHEYIQHFLRLISELDNIENTQKEQSAPEDTSDKNDGTPKDAIDGGYNGISQKKSRKEIAAAQKAGRVREAQDITIRLARDEALVWLARKNNTINQRGPPVYLVESKKITYGAVYLADKNVIYIQTSFLDKVLFSRNPAVFLRKVFVHELNNNPNHHLNRAVEEKFEIDYLSGRKISSNQSINVPVKFQQTIDSTPAPELPLKVRIAQHITENGPITFAEFFQRALYTPKQGYYVSNAVDIHNDSVGEQEYKDGRTFPTDSQKPAVGRALARQLVQLWTKLNQPEVFHVVEMGAGVGMLAVNILNTIREENAGLYQAARYIIVEISPALIEKQKLNVKQADHQNVIWLNASAFNLPLAGDSITGAVISNELIDAFPVHRVVVQGGETREIFIGFDPMKNRFIEQTGDLSTQKINEYFDIVGKLPPEGKEFAVNLKMLIWQNELYRVLRQGLVISADYGFKKTEHLLTLTQHEAVWNFSGNDYLDEIGIDITSYVDFETLSKYGQQIGFKTEYLGSFGRYLSDYANVRNIISDFVAVQSKLPVETQFNNKTDRKEKGEASLGLVSLIVVVSAWPLWGGLYVGTATLVLIIFGYLFWKSLQGLRESNLRLIPQANAPPALVDMLASRVGVSSDPASINLPQAKTEFYRTDEEEYLAIERMLAEKLHGPINSRDSLEEARAERRLNFAAALTSGLTFVGAEGGLGSAKSTSGALATILFSLRRDNRVAINYSNETLMEQAFQYLASPKADGIVRLSREQLGLGRSVRIVKITDDMMQKPENIWRLVEHADVVLISGHLRDVIKGRAIEQIDNRVFNAYQAVIINLAQRKNIFEEGSSLPSRPGTTMAQQTKGLGKQEAVVRLGFDVFFKAVAEIYLGGRKDVTAETFIKDAAIRDLILNPKMLQQLLGEIIDKERVDGVIVDTTSVGVIFKKAGEIETAYLQQLGVDVTRHKGEDGWQELAKILGNKERADGYRAMLNAIARALYELKALKTGSSTYTLDIDHPIPVAKAIDQVAHDVRDHSRLLAGARAFIHDAILGRAIDIENVEAGKTTVLVNTQDHFRDIVQNGGTVLITGGGLRGVQDDLKRQFGVTLYLGMKLNENKLAGARDAEYEQIVPEASQTIEEAASIRALLTTAYRRGNNILVTMPKELDWSPKMVVAFRNILPEGRMIFTDSNGATYEITADIKTLADVEKLIADKKLNKIAVDKLQTIHIDHPGLIHIVNGAGIGLDLKFNERLDLTFIAIADTTSPMERIRQAYRPRFAVKDSQLVILNMASAENTTQEQLRAEAVKRAWANQVQLDREVATERALTLVMEVNQRRLNLILEAEVRNNNRDAIRELIRVREIWRDGNEIFTMAYRGMERTVYTLQRAVEHSQTAFEQDLGRGSRAFGLLTPSVRERFVEPVLAEVIRNPRLLKIDLGRVESRSVVAMQIRNNAGRRLSYFEPTTVVEAVGAINSFNTPYDLTTHTPGVAGQAYSVVMGKPETRMSIHISQQTEPLTVRTYVNTLTDNETERARIYEAVMNRPELTMLNPVIAPVPAAPNVIARNEVTKQSNTQLEIASTYGLAMTNGGSIPISTLGTRNDTVILANNSALAFVINSLATATPEQLREFNRAVPALSAFGIKTIESRRKLTSVEAFDIAIALIDSGVVQIHHQNTYGLSQILQAAAIGEMASRDLVRAFTKEEYFAFARATASNPGLAVKEAALVVLAPVVRPGRNTEGATKQFNTQIEIASLTARNDVEAIESILTRRLTAQRAAWFAIRDNHNPDLSDTEERKKNERLWAALYSDTMSDVETLAGLIYSADTNIKKLVGNVLSLFAPSVQVSQRKGLLRQYSLLKEKAFGAFDIQLAGQITLGGLISHRIADEFFKNVNADEIADLELRAVFTQAKALTVEGKEIPAALAQSITNRIRRFAFMMIAGGSYRTREQLRDIEGVIAGLAASLNNEVDLRQTALNIPLRVLVSSLEDEYLYYLRAQVLPSAQEGSTAKEILLAAVQEQRSPQNIYPADLEKIVASVIASPAKRGEAIQSAYKIASPPAGTRNDVTSDKIYGLLGLGGKNSPRYARYQKNLTVYKQYREYMKGTKDSDPVDEVTVWNLAASNFKRTDASGVGLFKELAVEYVERKSRHVNASSAARDGEEVYDAKMKAQNEVFRGLAKISGDDLLKAYREAKRVSTLPEAERAIRYKVFKHFYPQIIRLMTSMQNVFSRDLGINLDHKDVLKVIISLNVMRRAIEKIERNANSASGSREIVLREVLGIDVNHPSDYEDRVGKRFELVHGRDMLKKGVAAAENRMFNDGRSSLRIRGTALTPDKKLKGAYPSYIDIHEVPHEQLHIAIDQLKRWGKVPARVNLDKVFGEGFEAQFLDESRNMIRDISFGPDGTYNELLATISSLRYASRYAKRHDTTIALPAHSLIGEGGIETMNAIRQGGVSFQNVRTAVEYFRPELAVKDTNDSTPGVDQGTGSSPVREFLRFMRRKFIGVPVDEGYAILEQKLLKAFAQGKKKIIVSIDGKPGAGKSALARWIQQRGIAGLSAGQVQVYYRDDYLKQFERDHYRSNRHILELANQSRAPLVIVEGAHIREVVYYNEFGQRMRDLRSIYLQRSYVLPDIQIKVTAPARVRRTRLFVREKSPGRVAMLMNVSLARGGYDLVIRNNDKTLASSPISSEAQEIVSQMLKSLNVLNDQIKQAVRPLKEDEVTIWIDNREKLGRQVLAELRRLEGNSAVPAGVRNIIIDVMVNRIAVVINWINFTSEVALGRKVETIQKIEKLFDAYEQQYNNLVLIVKRGELNNIKEYHGAGGVFTNLNNTSPTPGAGKVTGASSPVSVEIVSPAAAAKLQALDLKIVFIDADGTIWMGINLIPGIKELLTALRSHGIRIEIISGGSRVDSIQKAHALGVRELFDEINEAYDKAQNIAQRLGALGLNAAQAVMIGDGPGDISAAAVNGVLAVGFIFNGKIEMRLTFAGMDVLIRRDYLALNEILSMLKIKPSEPKGVIDASSAVWEKVNIDFTPVIDLINTKIPTGGIVTIDGLSGNGKTSTTRLLAKRLENSGRGNVVISGDAFLKERVLRDQYLREAAFNKTSRLDHPTLYRWDLINSFAAQLRVFLSSEGDLSEGRTFVIEQAQVRGQEGYSPISFNIKRGDLVILEFLYPLSIEGFKNPAENMLHVRLQGNPQYALRHYMQEVRRAYGQSDVEIRSAAYRHAHIPSWTKYVQETAEQVALYARSPSSIWPIRR
jgi:ADP-glucose type glycogen/starch synthase